MEQIQDSIPTIILILLPIFLAITAYTAKVKLKFSESEKEVWDWARSYADKTVTAIAVIVCIVGLFIEHNSVEPLTRETLFRILLYSFCLIIILYTIINKLFIDFLTKLLESMVNLHLRTLHVHESTAEISKDHLDMINDLYKKYYEQKNAD